MENITMINHSTRGIGSVITRTSGSLDCGIPLYLGKGDILVIGDFLRNTSLRYIGKSREGNLSFSIGKNRLVGPLPSQIHSLDANNMLLPFLQGNFLVSETDEGRIILQYER